MTSAVVFGGAGFIGTHLLRDLKARGYHPLVSVDIAEPKRPVEGVEYRCHDLTQPLDPAAFPRFDEAFNLAAVHRTPGHEPHEYYLANLCGATNIVRFCRETGIERLVFTSSIAVYGPGEDLKDESTPPTPTSDYGRSKLLAEGVHREWQAGAEARRLVIVRPAVVFGAGEGGNYTRLAQALRRGIFVYPGRRDTIKSGGYVGELVRTMRFALDRDEPVILYNFCYPDAYTIEDICRTFESVAGFKPPRGLVPLGVMNAAALPFEILNKAGLRNGIDRERIAKLVYSTRIHPGWLTQSGYRFESDLASALADWREQSHSSFL
ncbi:NAD(P)-dependent oxidoreductase [Aureimonas sp. AU4]|uniref:NAD-dependent epimerase/dehydratase family protein n=1 Tax=Aureimonas sp. AU4 TaxID=1638163 RepID=UPI0007821F73|nr:NAD(P)-dependent oxidoreductase [Aureimonas sp. AU4]